MADPALKQLQKLQVAFEAVPGTPLAATQQLVGEFAYTEEIARFFEDHPRGIRAPVTGGGDDLRTGTLFVTEQPLTFEDLLYPLSLGLDDPAVSGADPFVYTFAPALTGAAAIKAGTFEYVDEDGTTQHIERRSSFVTCRSWGINLASGEIGLLTAEYFGRKAEAQTFTPALTPLAGRTKIPSDLFQVFVDDTWAGLGGTQITGAIRSAELQVVNGAEPDYTLDGRPDLDFTQLRAMDITGTFTLLMELDAQAGDAGEYADYRAGSLRFIRLSAAIGTEIAQFDFAVKYVSPPVIETDEKTQLLRLEAELEYDPVGANVIAPVLTIDAIATLP